MKQAFLLIISLCSFAVLSAQKGKKIYLTKNGDNGSLINLGTSVGPGDTIVVRESLNPWSYIYCGGISGTAAQPIVILNEGAVEMGAGFDIENCRYIKLTGSGSKEKYGFSVRHSNGVALSIHGKSAHVEAERFRAEDCAFGCWIKNEADCDTSLNSWVLDNIRVHDFEMRGIRIEGFYAGSTDGDNASRPKDCNGVQHFYKPSPLGNIKIYNGIIDGTGRPAIMVSNARVGMTEIYNNVISNVGREYNDQQGTGISIGLYTRAYVHHNKIRSTYTWGIASLGGSGLIRIENNEVDSSGSLDGKSLAWPQNIVVDTRLTQPADSTRFIVINNKVSNPGKSSKNIEIWKSADTYGSNNLICNNTSKGRPASLGLAPGITWRNCGVPETSAAATDYKKMLLYVAAGAAVLGAGIVVYRRLRTARRGSARIAAS